MLQKRIDFGFNGYQVPFVPKAARSSRRKVPATKKFGNDTMCAFDLLATVANELLSEGDTSPGAFAENDQVMSNGDVVMKEQRNEADLMKVDDCDQVDVEAPSLSLELGLQSHVHFNNVKEMLGTQQYASSGPASEVTSSDCLDKDDSLDMMDLNDDKGEFCSHAGLSDGHSEDHRESCLPDMNQCLEQDEGQVHLALGNKPNKCSPEDSKLFDGNPSAMLGSDIKLSLGLNLDSCNSLSPPLGNNVDVVCRDDDENSSECTHPSTVKMNRTPTRIGDRRIRKLLASKYWRVAPKAKDGDFSDTELRYVYRSRKIGYRRQRSQRIYPFKKRKYFHYSSLTNHDGVVGCKGIHPPEKAADASATGQSTTFPARENHVKLRIKSFRVPELFIEMPENATIGSLKRTVMEAVTALLGGGLRVGVLLQGKRVRDDSRTLSQSGICHGDKVESVGFSLEPNTAHASPSVLLGQNSLALTTEDLEPPSRCATYGKIDQGFSDHSLDYPMTNLSSLIESDHDSAPFPAQMSAEKGTVDSRAMVALPEESPQAIAVLPAERKCKRTEMQRRIRRPFSVTEVESLVQAVEQLGTGRWRDVKLKAFENVKHRTYVDLKDKWKTLVHTARISPQQRRGEPVPQELLDRVLAAHGYWSQQQAKQQLKQPSEACLLL